MLKGIQHTIKDGKQIFCCSVFALVEICDNPTNAKNCSKQLGKITEGYLFFCNSRFLHFFTV